MYLVDRVRKGFTVIQAAILGVAECGSWTVPNAYGERPFVGDNPTEPNEAYFGHVNHLVQRATSLGLYVALLPCWGSDVTGEKGNRIFDASTAYRHGEFLGRRYCEESNIIWILGGDRNPVGQGEDFRDVWRAMAAGLRQGHKGAHLMTYHPRGGGHSSSIWFHNDEWLDFNMMQTGPRRDFPNYERIAYDYDLRPAKPIIDGEPGYEDAHPGVDPANGRLSDLDVRRYAYWALFAGAHGHTYGCLEVWQMYKPSYEPINGVRAFWYEALDFPGALQMQHMRRLVQSRPFLNRIPDQSIVASDQGAGSDRVQVTRGADGGYAFVYIPSGRPVDIRMDALRGESVDAYWYDPRTGLAFITNPVELDAGDVAPGRLITAEMSPREGVLAAQWLGLTVALPCHYINPDCEDVREFCDLLERARAAGERAPKPVVLRPGEILPLEPVPDDR